jgi:hypothetical protein
LSRATKLDFGKLNSGLVEQIAFDCDIRRASWLVSAAGKLHAGLNKAIDPSVVETAVTTG